MDVESVLRPDVEDGLQLGGVGHQQGDIQHALGRTLFSGIVINVDGADHFTRLGCVSL